MSVDQLPIEVLLLVALGAWSVYGLVVLHDAHRVRRHDRDAQRRALRVLEEGMQHRVPNDEVEQREANSSAERPAQQSHDVHARRVAA